MLDKYYEIEVDRVAGDRRTSLGGDAKFLVGSIGLQEQHSNENTLNYRGCFCASSLMIAVKGPYANGLG